MSISSTRITATPLPDGANLLEALRMLVSNDPFAGVFAKAVLKAFGQACPEKNVEKIEQLLVLWDTLMPEADSPYLPYNRQILVQARDFVGSK